MLGAQRKIIVSLKRVGLNLIHRDTALVGRVLQRYFEVAPEHVEATAILYQSLYTQDGTTTPEIAQAAVNALAKSLDIRTPIPWQQVYPDELG